MTTVKWLTPPCPHCAEASLRRVTREQAAALRKRTPVQEIFPDLDPEEREIFISGIHPRCFTAMFGQP